MRGLTNVAQLAGGAPCVLGNKADFRAGQAAVPPIVTPSNQKGGISSQLSIVHEVNIIRDISGCWHGHKTNYFSLQIH